MTNLTIAITAGLALSLSQVALAQTASAPAAPGAAAPVLRTGSLLRSSDGHRIGFIDTVDQGPDGKPTMVEVLISGHVTRIPASTISTGEKSTLVTSLSYHDVMKM